MNDWVIWVAVGLFLAKWVYNIFKKEEPEEPRWRSERRGDDWAEGAGAADNGF